MSESGFAPSSPGVSVVVIGRNEGDRLRQCLTSVLAMRYPSSLLEVIYVDSSSVDGSVEMAQALGVTTISLSAGAATAARGRNAGWRVARFPFVFFLDGDTVLDPDFVAAAMPHFADESVTGIWGIRRESDPDGSIYNAVLDLDWGVPESFGGDAIVRRGALESIDGYNEALIAGEDPEMCRRMRDKGFRNLYLPIAMTEHDLAIHHWSQYWRRSIRTGHAYAEVSGMYAQTDDPLWLRKSRRNLVRGIGWMAAPFVCVALSIVLRSPLPVLMFLAGALGVILRTAWKARQKAGRLSKALAYGLHSHLQQVPIFLGQLRYFGRKWRHHKPTLIEYKT